MTTSIMREAWLPIDISSPLIYCMKCFRTTTSHNGGFYVMECGHIFCDSHVEIANVSNVASQNFPMNHSCPHCKLTDISVYRIGRENAQLPPDLAVHFDDFLLSLKRYFESIKYNYESLTFLIRHYQSLPNASELEKQVRHQKDVIAKMVPALEKSALWESTAVRLTVENENLRQRLNIATESPNRHHPPNEASLQSSQLQAPMAPPNNHSHVSSKAGQGFNTPESSRNAGKSSSLNLESFAYHERQLPTVLTPPSGGARGRRSSAPSIGSRTRNNPASSSEANGIGSRSRISTPALSHIEDNTIDHPSPTPSRAKFGRTNVIRPIPVYGIGSPEQRSEKEANRSPYFKSPAPRLFQRYESSPVARTVPHLRHSNGSTVRQHPGSPGYNDGSFSSSSRTRFPSSHVMQDQNSHFHPIKRPATSSGYAPAHRGAGMYRAPSDANTPIGLSRSASHRQFEAAPGMRTTAVGAARSGGSSVLSQPNGHSALTNIRNVRRVPFNRS